MDSPFFVKDGWLYRKVRGAENLLANFYVEIIGQKIIIDENTTNARYFDLCLHLEGRKIQFSISSKDFLGRKFREKIVEIAGSSAILYGTVKDLYIATQELSPANTPVKTVTTSHGFDNAGNYRTGSLLIKSNGIESNPDMDIDLSAGTFSRNIGLLPPDDQKIVALGKHLAEDFLELKSHDVMYAIAGHIALAPFTSMITAVSGVKKTAMHLEGPSGCGKTFLCSLSAAFFGQIDGMLPSWSSTANALEKEGFYFRDCVFPIDDFKASIVDKSVTIRILQAHADSHGRSRLNTKAQIQAPPFIRGLILSTGEDFPEGVESVNARTIRLHVSPEKDQNRADRCWDARHLYPMFLPGLIRSVIAKTDWGDQFKAHLHDMRKILSSHASELSNGLRICSNLALNSFGFQVFINYLAELGTITGAKRHQMASEYLEIVVRLLERQVDDLSNHSPVETFFQIIGQRICASAVTVLNLWERGGTAKGKIIGKARNEENTVFIFPDLAMEVVASHFTAIREPMPFTKKTLRDAFAREKMITQSNPGRWTSQVRGIKGDRHQAWKFDLREFIDRCGFQQYGEESSGLC